MNNENYELMMLIEVKKYFKNVPVTILKYEWYSEKQGRVLLFDGNFCWKLVYHLENNKLVLVDNVSGIMNVI